MQKVTYPPYVSPTAISEDCLFLNVFTPPTRANVSGLAVLVFFYGGGYTQGYSGGWLYNGTNLAFGTNSVVVTVNYRVGILGFLLDESNGLLGNQGYLDTVFATQWTKRNIAQFGGDAAKMTVFGQSAGARNVGVMLADLTLGGLFQNAIMESHGMTATLMTPDDWVQVRADFYDALRCHEEKCLYTRTSAEILAAQQSVRMMDRDGDFGADFGPTRGVSPHIALPSLFAVQQNRYNQDVNVMMGVNANEAWLFEPAPLDALAYNASLLRLARGDAGDFERIFAAYPCAQCGDVARQNNYALMRTDYGFKCPARNGSAAIAAHGNAGAIFFYNFAHASSFTSQMFAWAKEHQCFDRACHTFELPYVFRGDFEDCTGCGDASWTPNETLLAQQMQYYWATFALHGEPGDGQGVYTDVEWAPFGVEKEESMLFQTGELRMEQNYDSLHCDLWDSLR